MLLINGTGLNALMRLTCTDSGVAGRDPTRPGFVEAGLAVFSPTYGIPTTGSFSIGGLYYPNISDVVIPPTPAGPVGNFFSLFPP
jgi:hypothetical protein